MSLLSQPITLYRVVAQLEYDYDMDAMALELN